MDKISYVIGTNITISFAYVIAKYPNDFFYDFATVVCCVLLVHRYITFWFNGWHMYLSDFCYFANFCVLYFINFAPKSSVLFIMSYCFGHGVLAVAVLAFRNSYVPHKIDMLTSVMIHAVPYVVTLHIKWYTIPAQLHLPIDQQRFAPVPIFETWSDSATYLFGYPILFYFFWVVIYYIIQFVITEKVLSLEYDSVFRTFLGNKA